MPEFLLITKMFSIFHDSKRVLCGRALQFLAMTKSMPQSVEFVARGHTRFSVQLQRHKINKLR